MRHGMRQQPSAASFPRAPGTPSSLTRASGLYVHVPFCRRRCSYCGFHSQTDVSARMVERYLDALSREAALYGGAWRDFDTVYLGGGTPSVLATEHLERLLEVLVSMGLGPGAEFTVEANPDDVTPGILYVLRSAGVNRISLGVQSFDDRMLGFLGRRHDADGARSAVHRVFQAGFRELSLDLIYGLPGQRLKDWQDQLGEALLLEPGHISTYELTPEPGTALERMLRSAAVHLPPEDLRADMFHLAHDLLGSRGWCHYEVSNHALSGAHEARHNSAYWEHVPYLGLGPAAHSFDGNSRWWNVSSVPEYCQRLEQGSTARAGSEELDASMLRLERLALGFRTRRGVSLADLAGRKEELAGALADGLLLVEGARAQPTAQGMLVADWLARCFA